MLRHITRRPLLRLHIPDPLPPRLVRRPAVYITRSLPLLYSRQILPNCPSLRSNSTLQLRKPTFSPPSPSSYSTMATVESAKKSAAFKAVGDHFDPSASYVGIGSGTTVVYVVEAIKAASTNPSVRFVPTGSQSLSVILSAGLTPTTLDELPDTVLLDVAFDGADEVDADLNCIKGGGACLFQEKLVAERARRFVCVADYRKDRDRLLSGWKYVPVEVAPIAAKTALEALRALGSENPVVRMAKNGDEPMKTDQGFYIVDAPFPGPLAVEEDGGKSDKWEPEKLSVAIKAITGVLEVGLFTGPDGRELEASGLSKGGQKPVAVYFGMEDGSVKVRTKK